ncbi:MAG: hypothetical protein SFT94_12650 [Pseudanabaenaceae cyanobacterium bins.68]|nr:hypothetical protein [Pseudanabaenaceae cyanobacterium bins.68]
MYPFEPDPHYLKSWRRREFFRIILTLGGIGAMLSLHRLRHPPRSRP